MELYFDFSLHVIVSIVSMVHKFNHLDVSLSSCFLLWTVCYLIFFCFVFSFFHHMPWIFVLCDTINSTFIHGRRGLLGGGGIEPVCQKLPILQTCMLLEISFSVSVYTFCYSVKVECAFPHMVVSIVSVWCCYHAALFLGDCGIITRMLQKGPKN